MYDSVVTVHPHPTRETVWSVHWRPDAEATVGDVIAMEEVRQSDSLIGLVTVIRPWIHHVTVHPSSDAMAVTIVGLEDLPLALIAEVCAAAPSFRSAGPSGDAA